MTTSRQETTNWCEATFKWVQHTPVRHLKGLSDDDLDRIREQLIKEVREVGRAIHWIDGIVKLTLIEANEQSANIPAEVRS